MIMNKICKICGTEIIKKINESKKSFSERKYCSKKCSNKSKESIIIGKGE